MLISIQAGNSDNKLTQMEWSEFVDHLDTVLNAYETARHFFGGSVTWAKWQNVCWVFEIPSGHYDDLVTDIRQIREQYRQDSVCMLAGDAEFI